jgi:NADH dehydrogenase
MATIGRNRAVAEIGKYQFTGTVAWLLWGLIHVLFLVGFRNRFAVLAQWIWDYITFSKGARLITGKSHPRIRQHHSDFLVPKDPDQTTQTSA